MSDPVVVAIVTERAMLRQGDVDLDSIAVYGNWHDESATKRAKRGKLDLATLKQVLIRVHGVRGTDYLVRGHVAKDEYNRYWGITARRDGKMQLSLGPSPDGYLEGVTFFAPPAN